MSTSKRVLLIGGIALAIWGMAYGLWYAVFAEHQALDGIGAALAASFSHAAHRDLPGVQAAMAAYRETKYVYDRQVDVHGHWIGLAMLLVLVGIGFDRVAFSERVRFLLAVGLLVGAVLFPLGVLLQTMDRGALPRALAIVGSGLVIAALAGVALGAARGADSPPAD